MTETLVVAQILMDIIMALALFILSGIRSDLKELTKAHDILSNLLAREYIPRIEINAELKVMKERMHDIMKDISNWKIETLKDRE